MNILISQCTYFATLNIIQTLTCRGLVGVCELKLVHKLCFLLGERRVANAGGGEAEHKPITAAEEAKEEEIEGAGEGGGEHEGPR